MTHVLVPKEPTRKQIEDLARHWGYSVEEAAEVYAAILDFVALDGDQADLLAALEAAASSAGFQYMLSETRDQIDAALAQARKEQP